MTCVAAVARDGRVFIGSDSCASGDGVFIVSASPKVVKINDLIVGFAGSWSIGRRVFRFLTKTNDVEKLLDTFDAEDDDEWSLLFGIDGRLYEATGGDRSLVEVRPNEFGVSYHAIGTGQAVALGSLYGDHKRNAQSVLNALEAAAFFTPDVRAPFNVVSN